MPALHVWGHLWKHSRLLFHCNNAAVVDVISHNTSRDPYMLAILRQLMLISMHHDFIIRASHLPGKVNVKVDHLSHFQANQTFLQQHSLCSQLESLPPEVLSSLLL